MQKTMEGMIQSISLTTEIRDAYTAGHQRRTARLACAIAEEMSLSLDQIQGTRIAGEIHDLGKISVPAEILSKSGRISDAEFALIKNHPQTGFDILKGIDFPWPIAQIVQQHHERLDGSGYPLGLAGDQILLGARVLAVADVVEAMASHRPYRPALGIDQAIDEVTRQRGKAFDPSVVDAFVRLHNEKGYMVE